LLVLHEVLEGVGNTLSSKPITLGCNAVDCNHAIFAAVGGDSCEKHRLTVLLNNVMANVARNMIKVHRIVEVIPYYWIPAKAR
jgi:hypothetical protein